MFAFVLFGIFALVGTVFFAVGIMDVMMNGFSANIMFSVIGLLFGSLGYLGIISSFKDMQKMKRLYEGGIYINAKVTDIYEDWRTEVNGYPALKIAADYVYPGTETTVHMESENFFSEVPMVEIGDCVRVYVNDKRNITEYAFDWDHITQPVV